MAADRELALHGFKENTFRIEHIAEIPVFEGLVVLGADPLVIEVDLQAPCRILECCKAGLSLDAFKHHSPGDTHLDMLGFELLAGMVFVAPV